MYMDGSRVDGKEEVLALLDGAGIDLGLSNNRINILRSIPIKAIPSQISMIRVLHMYLHLK